MSTTRLIKEIAMSYCDVCRLKDGVAVFRGYYNRREVVQTFEGKIFSYPQGDYIGTSYDVEPYYDDDQVAIEIEITKTNSGCRCQWCKEQLASQDINQLKFF